MKLGKHGNLRYEFNVRKCRLGSLHSGAIFLHRRKLWMVLNPDQGNGGKLVRTLEGSMHKSKTMISKTQVYCIDKGTYRGLSEI